MEITNEIREMLFNEQDLKYRAFHAKLVPGADAEKIIGVRTPALRKIAKLMYKDERVAEFLESKHEYYEETNLHGFIISEEKDYERAVKAVDDFLPMVDNWATCDLLSPKAFKPKKVHDMLLKDIQRWMGSKEPFTIRFGIEMLMTYFLDEEFKPEYLRWVAAVKHEHYYVKMMVAWFFATALAKQWTWAVTFIEQKRLDEWTHKKAIQKAIESYRVSADQKEWLKTLRG